MYSVEWIAGAEARFPSSPVWHPGEGCFFWSDVDEGVLFRLDASTGAVTEALHDGRAIGAIAVQADGSLLLFRDRGLVERFSGGKVTDEVVPEIADLRRTRYACAAADSSGRILCAALSDARHPARYMLLDRSARLTTVRETVGIPAGIAFGDGCAYLSNRHVSRPEVLRVAYDVESPNPLDGDVERIIDASQPMKRSGPAPAGMAVLSDGSLLVSMRGGSEIAHIGADGESRESIRLQARRPTGLCMGGRGLDTLLVAAAGAHRKPVDGLHAGEVAAISGIPCPGMAPHFSRIGLDDDAAMPGMVETTADAPAARLAAEPEPTQFVSC